MKTDRGLSSLTVLALAGVLGFVAIEAVFGTFTVC